jgi:hypothetical protein
METNKEYLKRILPLLKKPIPHQWRVQSFSKTKPQATVLAYIDQRDMMDVLDTYCDYGWEKKYEEIAGNLFCSIGIRMPDNTIMWRSDCGVESMTEKEKGRASDAAKRAGVNWGIGRFLYDMKVQYVDANVKKEANNWPYCVDANGKQIWDLTAHINNKNPNAPQSPVSVAEPSTEAKVASMNNTTAPKELTAEQLKEHEDKIKLITEAVNIAGYYNALPEDLKANKTIQGYLSARREAIKVKV